MATQVAEQTAASAREQLVKEMQAKADEQNKTRTGKGTRLHVGQTRGKNPQVITWEAFDDSLPETLPTTLAEFMSLAKTEDEKAIVSMLVDGFNAQAYSAASDPIAEFINPEWDGDTVSRFRIVVRNYAANAEVSLEDA